jgi:hypothetical protein
MTAEGKVRLKEQLCAALLTGATIKSAAASARISSRTALRWLHSDPEFQRMYSEAKHAVLERMCNKLRAVAFDSVAGLYKLAHDKKTPAPTKAMAFRSLSDLLLRATELENFEDRLEAVERALQGGGE